MISAALEFLAEKNGNVVKYDRDGIPSVYVPFECCRSSDLHASLPGHVHPAFIVNGVVHDRILIAKYTAGIIEDREDKLYSLPGLKPAINMTYDNTLSKIRAFKPGHSSGMTVADHGLILLTALKNGWHPQGNNYDNTLHGNQWYAGRDYEMGDITYCNSWQWVCLANHHSSISNMPSDDAAYWKKGKHIGGTPCAQELGNFAYTLTGSGPKEWFLGNDPSSLADAVGNCFEYLYGYRIYNGELQILADNDAASPGADIFMGGSAWKAILPSANDSSCTLVNPGTAGTLKWNRGVLDTVASYGSYGAYFNEISANSANVSNVPYLLKELGLFPVVDDTINQGYCQLTTGSGAYTAAAGGGTLSNSYDGAGLGMINHRQSTSAQNNQTGARGRFIE